MVDITPKTRLLLNTLDRHRLWLWGLIGLVYLVGYNGHWRIGPDSAIHVEVARQLAQGNAYTHPTGLEQTIHPGLAYLTAATFRLLGQDQFYVINALMLACALATLIVVYQLVQRVCDRRTANVVTLLVAFNELFYRYAYQVLTDMPFLLGLMLLLLSLEYIRHPGALRWTGGLLGVVSLIVMAMFRSVVLTVLVACGLGSLWHVGTAIRSSRNIRHIASLLAATTFAFAAIAWLLIDPAMLRDSDKALSLLHTESFFELGHRILTDNGPNLLTEHLPEALLAVDLGPWLGGAVGILAVILGIGLFRIRPIWGALVLAFLIQWLLLITVRRYSLVILPLLAVGWWRMTAWLERRSSPQWAEWVVLGSLGLWLVPNAVKITDFILEQRAVPFLETYEDGRYAALSRVADALTELYRPGDQILADDAPQLIYLTRLPVFSAATLPTYGPEREATLERVRAAERILLVRPIERMLAERLEQIQAREIEVIRTVPTPVYHRHRNYQIALLQVRQADWDNFRRRREKRLRRLEATHQTEPQSEQRPAQSE